MNTNVHIICSDGKDAGKTLLSRICGDILSFSGHDTWLFDTDYPSGSLARWFPKNSEVINFVKMREQARLFDTMVNEPGRNYVVDLQPEHLEKFFTILHDTGFDEGAREAGIGTGVFHLPDLSEESLQRAAWIRARLTTASFTSVINQARFIIPRGAPYSTRLAEAAAYREVVLPQLSPVAAEWIEKPGFQFGWLFSGSLVRPPSEVRMELSFFMEKLQAWSRAAGWTGTLAL